MLSDVHVLLSERSEYPWMLSQNSGRAHWVVKKYYFCVQNS